MLAVNVGAVATPEPSVVTVAEAENVPLAPLPGGAKVTLTSGTGLLAASTTVALNGAAKAVLTVALCPLPEVTVIEVGTWFTVTVSVFEVAGLAAPAPEATAVLFTLVGELAGTFTVRVRLGKLKPADTTSVESVQVAAAVPVPVQLQLVPPKDASV
jgi:hypothetical protein